MSVALHRSIINNRRTNAIPLGTINKLLLPILAAAIVLLLVYMVWDLATHRQTEEGFATRKSGKLAKLKARDKHKNAKSPSPGQSKLSSLKKGKYDANQDLKSYGMDGGQDSEPDTNNSAKDLDTEIASLGAEIGEKTLNHLASEKSKGKRDNFKNVINEIDNINPGAFDFTSIGGTIRRYNENFNNRLNYAKSKNEGDNLETTMAQGRIIFDEFKKIFLFTDMFS
jgi:hypothetical protein